MTTHSKNKHFFTSQSLRESENSPGGVIRFLTSYEVPGLRNLSLVDMTLKKNGVLKPIWHPNAQKIGYCTQGQMLVSMHGPGESETFPVEKGEIFYVPQGYIHHIENTTRTDGIIKFSLNHGDPETMSLSRSVEAASDAALGSTLATDSDFVYGLKDSMSHELIGTLSQVSGASESYAHRYKFNIKKSNKAILTKGGYLQIGLKINLSALEGVGILGFGLNPHGAVEPHWHPNSDELVYVSTGKIRAMVLSPDGRVEKQELEAGEGFYAPASYFHSIENIGEGEMEGIAFFNNSEMVYMGLDEAWGSFSNEVLAATFNLDSNYFDTVNKPGSPLVIVPT